jgi:hypothetical protein
MTVTKPSSSPVLAQGSHYTDGPPGPYSMGEMAGALPGYAPHQPGQPYPGSRPSAGAPTPAVVYQFQQNLQYPPPNAPNYTSPAQYASYGQAAQSASSYGHPSGPGPSSYGSFYASQQPTGPAPYQHVGGQIPRQQMPGQYYYYQEFYPGGRSPTFPQPGFVPAFRGGGPLAGAPLPHPEASRKREPPLANYASGGPQGGRQRKTTRKSCYAKG